MKKSIFVYIKYNLVFSDLYLYFKIQDVCFQMKDFHDCGNTIKV